MIWRLNVKNARDRGDRIAREAERKSLDFQHQRARVAIATARAERAAVDLMTRSDDLADTIAAKRRA